MIGCLACRLARRSFLGLAAAGLASSALGAERTAPRRAACLGGRVIDFHAHMMEPSLPSLVPAQLNTPHLEAWYRQMKSPTEQIAHMDACGVDAHVVGYSNATQGLSWGDAAADLAIHRRINDGIAQAWVQAHPGRFVGAFGLPTQDLGRALPEFERAATTLGLQVLQISSVSPDGRYYGDPHFDPLWAAAQHFGTTVFIHPHGQDNRPPFDDFALANSVGQGVEEIKVMTSMIYNGVFDKFPNLKVVVAHGGGFLPHYYGRLDRNAVERPATVRNIKRLPSAYLKAFYYDSCVYAPEILRALIRVVGADRVVLGSDYPVGDADGLATLRRTPGLTPAELRAIAVGTPARLLAAKSVAAPKR